MTQHIKNCICISGFLLCIYVVRAHACACEWAGLTQRSPLRMGVYSTIMKQWPLRKRRGWIICFIDRSEKSHRCVSTKHINYIKMKKYKETLFTKGFLLECQSLHCHGQFGRSPFWAIFRVFLHLPSISAGLGDQDWVCVRPCLLVSSEPPLISEFFAPALPKE